MQASGEERSSGVWLGCVLLIALGLRLGWGLTRPTSEAAIDALPDQREYLKLAENLLHGRGLQFLDTRFADRVYAFRTPGYPLFVAACGANIRAVRAVQAAVDASTVLAVFLLAGALCGSSRRWTPLIAAALVAVNPFLVYFTGLILSETLFTAMLAWGMLLLVVGDGAARQSWRGVWIWLAGGLLLALSILVRPSAIALPVLLGIGAAFVNRTRPGAYQQPKESRRRGATTRVEGLRTMSLDGLSRSKRAEVWPIPVGTTMLLLTIVVLIPWWVRNFHVLGRWVWLDTNGGFTLYDGYNPDASGASDQSFVNREPELFALGEVERSRYLSLKAQAYARAHPGRDVQLAAAKLARTWSPMPLSREFGRPAYVAIALAYSLPLDVLVVLGLIFGQIPRSAKVLLLLPAIYFSIVHALTVGSLRYRIPVEPPMAVLAADFLGVWAAAGGSWRRAKLRDASDVPDRSM